MSWAITGVVALINKMPRVRWWLSKKVARKIVNQIGDMTMGFGNEPSRPQPSIKEQMAEKITSAIVKAIGELVENTDMSGGEKHYVLQFVGDVLFDYIMNEMEFMDLWRALDVAFHAKTRIRQYKPKIRDRFVELLTPVIDYALQDKQLVKIIATQLVKLLTQRTQGGQLDRNDREELRDAYLQFITQLGVKPDGTLRTILTKEINQL